LSYAGSASGDAGRTMDPGLLFAARIRVAHRRRYPWRAAARDSAPLASGGYSQARNLEYG